MDETKRLSIEEYRLLEDYRPVIRKGIQAATVDDKLRDYEHFEAKKECYEYELLIRLSRTFFSESPMLKTVKNWARKLTNIRKPSWHVAGIRQRESIQVMSGDHIFEYDDAGTIIATGLDNQDRIPHFSLSRQVDCDPEQSMIAKEQHMIVDQFAKHLRNSKKKRASEYLRIYQLQMSGVDVGEQHSTLLGIPKNKVKNYKHQMVEELRKFICSIDPDTLKQIGIFKGQKGKNWEVEKSTFQERTELNRVNPDGEEKKPKNLRVWRVLPGGEKKPQRPETVSAAIAP